jgi:hypothetical protein
LQQQQALKARFNQPPIIELVSKVNRAFSSESFRGCRRLGSKTRRWRQTPANTYASAFEVEHALRDFKLA